MDSLVDKIKRIQNKQRTLRWGSAESDAGEAILVVASTAYPQQMQCFAIGKNYEMFLVSDSHKKVPYRKCENEKEVVDCVIGLLKKWFPAKGN